RSPHPPIRSGNLQHTRGLGLFIAAQIMESFGGTISLLPNRNSEGRRHIFELDLTSISRG
ncbi:hypothetical protein, partial [Sphingomonas sp. 66-10]|uniref:hypothetical protein n=1 Tax=Sphingomonas sp. 66-10 TaxID=1895848 RepID=UPI00257BCD40